RGGEAGKGVGGAGADRVPGKGRPGGKFKRPKARAAITRKVCNIDIGRARSRAHCCGRIAVTAGQAGAPLAEATIEPGENAPEITAYIGGVAVAVDPTPGANALCPEREIRRLRSRSKQLVNRLRGPSGVAISQTAARGRICIGQNWAARAKRGESAGVTRIGRLAQAPQHRLPDVAAVLDDGRLHAAVDFARERIERLQRSS